MTARECHPEHSEGSIADLRVIIRPHEKWHGAFVVIYSMFDIMKQVSIQQCGPQLRGVLPPWNHLKYLCTPGQALKRPIAGLSYHSCAAKSPGAWLAGFSAFCWD